MSFSLENRAICTTCKFHVALVKFRIISCVQFRMKISKDRTFFVIEKFCLCCVVQLLRWNNIKGRFAKIAKNQTLFLRIPRGELVSIRVREQDRREGKLKLLDSVSARMTESVAIWASRRHPTRHPVIRRSGVNRSLSRLPLDVLCSSGSISLDRLFLGRASIRSVGFTKRARILRKVQCETRSRTRRILRAFFDSPPASFNGDQHERRKERGFPWATSDATRCFFSVLLLLLLLLRPTLVADTFESFSEGFSMSADLGASIVRYHSRWSDLVDLGRH